MRYALVTGLAGCVTLASCGGGSGSLGEVLSRNAPLSVAVPAPAPVSDPAPPPAPTPTPPPLPGLPTGLDTGATSASQPGVRGPAQIQAEMNTLSDAIKAEVGVPRATSVAACVLAPIGARACGGPAGYLLYSRAVSNEARLLELVRQYTALSAEYNAAAGVASICSLAQPPQVELVDGVCTAR